MKRILNLNDFSLPALKTILIIGLVLPAALLLSSTLLDQAGLHLPVLHQLIGVLFGMAVFLLLLFFGLVILEQIQDHFLYRRYLQERGRQIQGECPFCGNRQLHPFEHFCSVCGEKIRV